MAYKIIINKRFIDRVSDLLIFLEEEWGKKVADDFVVKVDYKINSIQQHPYIGTLTRFKNVRGMNVTKHNRIYYKVKGNKVTILNLYDTRRKNYG